MLAVNDTGGVKSEVSSATTVIVATPTDKNVSAPSLRTETNVGGVAL